MIQNFKNTIFFEKCIASNYSLCLEEVFLNNRNLRQKSIINYFFLINFSLPKIINKVHNI